MRNFTNGLPDSKVVATQSKMKKVMLFVFFFPFQISNFSLKFKRSVSTIDVFQGIRDKIAKRGHCRDETTPSMFTITKSLFTDLALHNSKFSYFLHGPHVRRTISLL